MSGRRWRSAIVLVTASLVWQVAPPSLQAAPQTAAGDSVAVPSLKPSDERQLRTRVTEWWTARITRDHQKMYELFEPSYRKQVSLAAFVKESAIRTKYDLADARIEALVPETPSQVLVKIDVEARPPGLPVGRVTAEDRWVRISGKWYKVHQDSPPPFTVIR